MKQTLAFLIIAASITAQAASINWQVSSVRKTYLWDSTDSKGNVSAYLVLASDVATITNPTEEKNFDTLLNEYKLDKVDLSEGAYKVDERTASSNSLTARSDGGEKYQFQIILVDDNGKYALSAATDPTYAFNVGEDETSILFTNTDVGAAANAGGTNWGEKPVYGGGETPGVPEPATGALALAGVALLFKRRRA